ncbi:hypothetical protein GCM10011383_34290 [Hymenobacter cavernae]|uniref:Macroglobulin domain-containing protein n=1 Tax=Hymenobacter cavernae TaxID=2044852 RepID=A0ABQ1UJX0_9BACT|nr:hypothetical protein GCM10011383_34290 [Hymenobacter cavernae]
MLLDVARFRNQDQTVKGAEVEIYVTVPSQSLTYRQRAPKTFQAAATVTLEILKADGKPAYQETITLKPPVLNDTTAAIKNPLSFQKRIVLLDGSYTLRGRVRDQYHAGAEGTAEMPLVLQSAGKGTALSDLVLLARPAAKSPGQNNFTRGGYLLTRTPGGMYTRGANQLYFYAELYQAPQSQKLSLRYHLQSEEGAAADAEASLDNVAAGKPTTILGELPLGPLPTGNYTLTVDVLDARKQVLASQTAHVRREAETYAPAGAAVPK